jgi:hypothetical protein
MMTEEKNTFDHQVPNEEQVKRIETLRQGYKSLEAVIKGTTLPSRHQSLAITNLEQSAMWAIKSIVFE